MCRKKAFRKSTLQVGASTTRIGGRRDPDAEVQFYYNSDTSCDCADAAAASLSNEHSDDVPATDERSGCGLINNVEDEP